MKFLLSLALAYVAIAAPVAKLSHEARECLLTELNAPEPRKRHCAYNAIAKARDPQFQVSLPLQSTLFRIGLS